MREALVNARRTLTVAMAVCMGFVFGTLWSRAGVLPARAPALNHWNAALAAVAPFGWRDLQPLPGAAAVLLRHDLPSLHSVQDNEVYRIKIVDGFPGPKRLPYVT